MQLKQIIVTVEKSLNGKINHLKLKTNFYLTLFLTHEYNKPMIAQTQTKIPNFLTKHFTFL